MKQMQSMGKGSNPHSTSKGSLGTKTPDQHAKAGNRTTRTNGSKKTTPLQAASQTPGKREVTKRGSSQKTELDMNLGGTKGAAQKAGGKFGG